MDEMKVDPMYMENLEEWILEENKVVTYKYLSRALKVHVNVAKQMLYNFVTSNKSKQLLGIVYLISGLVENEKSNDDGVTEACSLKVTLVKEKDLDHVVNKFSQVYSKHIYSVQLSDEVSLTSLYATDLEVFKEDPLSSTSLCSIKNKNAIPREAIRVPVEIKKPDIKKEVKPEVKKEVKKSGIESAFAKTKKQSPKKAVVAADEVKTTETLKSVKENKKSAAPNHIANFFAKQSSKPKQEKSVVENSETKSEEKENVVNERIENESTSVKSKEVPKSPGKAVLTSTVTSPKKKNKSLGDKKKDKKADEDSKKRKRIQVMSDSEDEGVDDDEALSTENIAEEAPPTSKLIESSDDEIPPTPKQATRTSRPGRRRIRRQVDKTYVDDQGFMVTKKEYESASETDDEPEPFKEKEAIKSEKVEAPQAKKAKLAAPGTKAQTGIMSFFKKK